MSLQYHCTGFDYNDLIGLVIHIKMKRWLLNITDPVPLLCIEYPIQNLFNVSFVYKSMNEIFSLKRNKQHTIVGWFYTFPYELLIYMYFTWFWKGINMATWRLGITFILHGNYYNDDLRLEEKEHIDNQSHWKLVFFSTQNVNLILISIFYIYHCTFFVIFTVYNFQPVSSMLWVFCPSRRLSTQNEPWFGSYFCYRHTCTMTSVFDPRRRRGTNVT